MPSRTRWIGLVLAALLLPLAPLHVPGAEAATTRALVITNASAKPQVSFAAFDGNPAKLFDVDRDGDLEIIAQNDNQWVYVFDSRTGAILAQLKTAFPAGWGARSFNGPEVAILSDGGSPRLVVANSAAVLTVYRYDAQGSSAARFVFTKQWEHRLDDCHANPGMDSKPVLADLDRDGRLEILAGTEEAGLYAFRDDGRLYWRNCLGGGNAEPTVADLNLDGWPDVVHVSDGGVVSALNGRTGAWMWSFNVRSRFNVGSGSMPVGATVAQLDGLGGPDIVVGARDSHDAKVFTNNHALLLALDHAGRLLWGRQDPMANPLTYTHPIVVDEDRDGKAEVYWGDWNTMGHKPPDDPDLAFQRLGDAHFYRFDRSGNLVWRTTLGTYWSNKDLAMADVDGDGVHEVLANGPNAGHDGIWYLNPRTGAKEAFVDTYPYQVSRGPVVADLWNTGTMQWVVEAGSAILVYDTHVRYNALWPHLPYVSRSPGGTPPPTSSTPPPTTSTPPPTTSSPPLTTPPPGSTFGATFTIKSPNAWWQEVTVTPDTPRALAKVEVRINSGAWQPMAQRSWGAWTSSYSSPAGSRVEFRATDTGGATSTSVPFTWLDGTLSKRSVGSAPFTASFEPRAVGNDWWVEVRVTASEPLQGVETSISGGAWTPLSATSWGTWAKSLAAPDGSQVRFRATGTSGGSATSATYTWT